MYNDIEVTRKSNDTDRTYRQEGRLRIVIQFRVHYLEYRIIIMYKRNINSIQLSN